jgi:hypothetical protein
MPRPLPGFSHAPMFRTICRIPATFLNSLTKKSLLLEFEVCSVLKIFDESISSSASFSAIRHTRDSYRDCGLSEMQSALVRSLFRHSERT